MAHHRISRLARVAAFAAPTLLLLACGPGFNELSGKDARRSGARGLPMNRPVDDRVSADDGDQTDWKTFTLEGPATVTLNLWWDEPDEIEATIAIRDSFTRAVATLKHTQHGRTERLGPIALTAGDWYVEVLTEEGASVYTMELETDAKAGGAPTGGNRPGF